MKKSLFKFLLLLLFPFTMSAQEFSADFTATDINGEEHNLYQLLDDGKMVILDIFTTWCGPCWTLHESGILKDLWQSHGPDGSDEIYIFSIESDVNTTNDNLMGIGTGTYGDWTENVPYPIIDENELGLNPEFELGKIATSFNVVGFPTVIFICPDRTYTDVNWQSINQVFNTSLTNCSTPIQLEDNNVRIEEVSGAYGDNCDDQEFAPEVKVRNIGNVDVSAFTADLMIDGSSVQNIVFNGSVPTYGAETLIFDPVSFDSGSYTWGIEISGVNNTSIDDDPSNNNEEIDLRIGNTTNQDSVIVRINTDDGGDEIFWAILSEDQSEVYASGGNSEVGLDGFFFIDGDNTPASSDAYEDNEEYAITVAIPDDGCYIFYINDYQTDGFLGDGFIQMENLNGDIIVEDPPFQGVFEFFIPQYTFSKTAGSVSVDDNLVQLSELEVYPNPSSNTIHLRFDDVNSITSASIYTIEGVLVQSHVTDFLNPIDISNLQTGLYILNTTLDNGLNVSTRFVKE